MAVAESLGSEGPQDGLDIWRARVRGLSLTQAIGPHMVGGKPERSQDGSPEWTLSASRKARDPLGKSRRALGGWNWVEGPGRLAAETMGILGS